MKKNTLATFEAVHGQPKLKRLQAQLEAEKVKVEQLAGTHDKIHVIKSTRKNSLKFAVFGDTQFGSLYAAGECLEAFAAHCGEVGCEMLLHTGDVLDGWKVYRGQEFELRDVGLEAQLARAGDAARHMAGMPVRFITGNHDLSFKSIAGANVGRLIAEATGWTHVGDEQAALELRTVEGKTYQVGLYHPGGGTSYALSYRVQKLVESLDPRSKPQMACYGHYHKSEFIPTYRNCSILQSGAFQWQTPFMGRQGLAAHVGGWVVEVTPGDTYNVVNAEFVAFYK